MVDCIIDTNVLLVASEKCDHIPADQQLIVFDWLTAFRSDRRRSVVLDQSMNRKGSIWKEYHNKMTGQDLGLLVVTEKLQLALVRFLDVDYDSNNYGCVPAHLGSVDRSDRVFVAVALKDKSQDGNSEIVNAIDADWCECEQALKDAGIIVEQLIDGFCEDKRTGEAKSQTKRSSKTKK